MSLLSHWGQHFLAWWPNPPHGLLISAESVLRAARPALWAHLKERAVDTPALFWGIISTFFRDSMDDLHADLVMDALFTRPETPELLIYYAVAVVVEKEATVRKLSKKAQITQLFSKKGFVNNKRLGQLVSQMEKSCPYQD